MVDRNDFIVIQGTKLKALQFLVINAQLYLNSKRELTDIDKKALKLAGDITTQISYFNRRG